MKILMISYYPPEHEGRVERSIKMFTKDNDLIIVTCNSKNEKYNNADIISVALSGKSNIKKYVEFCIKTVWNVIKKRDKYDVIYAHNYFAAFPTLLLRLLKYSSKIIYDAYELLIPSGGLKFSLRDYVFYYLEKLLIKQSDLVICANDIRGYVMYGYYKLRNLPITIQNVLEISDEEKVVKEINENSIIKIVYAGNISGDRKIEEIIKATKNLGERFHLIIAGDGSELNNLKQLARDIQMKNITFIGRYTRDELKDILKDCHIGYVSYPNIGINNVFCAPNKISEYAIHRLPIIASENHGLNNIVNKYNIGIATNKLEAGILKIVDNYEVYKANIENYLIENNWNNETEKIKDIVMLMQ